MSLKLYRRGPSGLEPSQAVSEDCRTRLRSPRWNLPRLANPEAAPVTALSGVLFFGALAVITFVILLVGYGSGFWH